MTEQLRTAFEAETRIGLVIPLTTTLLTCPKVRFPVLMFKKLSFVNSHGASTPPIEHLSPSTLGNLATSRKIETSFGTGVVVVATEVRSILNVQSAETPGRSGTIDPTEQRDAFGVAAIVNCPVAKVAAAKVGKVVGTFTRLLLL